MFSSTIFIDGFLHVEIFPGNDNSTTDSANVWSNNRSTGLRTEFIWINGLQFWQ